MMRSLLPAMAALLIVACAQPDDGLTLDEAGEQFVRLGLELGEYDDYYIDSYVGPEEWQQQATLSLRSKEQLATDIAAFFAAVETIEPTTDEESQRHKSLLGKVQAMDTRIRMVNGEEFTFVEEARLILDVEVPRYEFADFDRVLDQMDALVPGDGELIDRIEALRVSVVIPDDKMDAVFNRAIEECVSRTSKYIDMPDDERFQLEYVTGVSWGGYLEYLGDNESLMSINRDIPMTLDRAVDLGCHEGYPGHHVYNLLVDQRYLKDKGWVEFQLQPLYAPAMLVHEGSAEYGVQLAFPGNESLEFQLAVLAPLAGLDPDNVRAWDELLALRSQLGDFAVTATAQRYLDGEITRDEAIALRQKYGLHPLERAERNIRFAEEVRSYVLNYSLGEEIVAAWIEARAGDDPEARWEAFMQLINELPAPSDMVQ
jgi:hypothetical protein